MVSVQSSSDDVTPLAPSADTALQQQQQQQQHYGAAAAVASVHAAPPPPPPLPPPPPPPLADPLVTTPFGRSGLGTTMSHGLGGGAQAGASVFGAHTGSSAQMAFGAQRVGVADRMLCGTGASGWGEGGASGAGAGRYLPALSIVSQAQQQQQQQQHGGMLYGTYTSGGGGGTGGAGGAGGDMYSTVSSAYERVRYEETGVCGRREDFVGAVGGGAEELEESRADEGRFGIDSLMGHNGGAS